MKWNEVKKGQLVTGIQNSIGYIYKLNEKTKEVKVDWSISLAEWHIPEELQLIEMNDFNHFFNRAKEVRGGMNDI